MASQSTNTPIVSANITTRLAQLTAEVNKHHPILSATQPTRANTLALSAQIIELTKLQHQKALIACQVLEWQAYSQSWRLTPDIKAALRRIQDVRRDGFDVEGEPVATDAALRVLCKLEELASVDGRALEFTLWVADWLERFVTTRGAARILDLVDWLEKEGSQNTFGRANLALVYMDMGGRDEHARVEWLKWYATMMLTNQDLHTYAVMMNETEYDPDDDSGEEFGF